MYEYLALCEEICITSREGLGMKTILATFLAVLTAMLTAVKALAPILVMLLIISFILDFWMSWRENKIQAIIIKKAIAKVLLYCLACMVVGLAAQAISVTIGTTCGIDVWFVCLVCINEALACLAILAKLGFPVPQWVIDKLQSFNEGPPNAK